MFTAELDKVKKLQKDLRTFLDRLQHQQDESEERLQKEIDFNAQKTESVLDTSKHDICAELAQLKASNTHISTQVTDFTQVIENIEKALAKIAQASKKK